ncbi:anhydro-N-acetylmuramic acid kinase [Agaribacterium sp. ZY112]|uniref:anhydro-N-acetylmuramic acid kinase n=1 Tax=Agaribacterium sp. ZY112 TaxID=3233574 RepID=UPI003525CB40
MSSRPERYIGLMSGTSVDGIDAALLEIDNTSIKLIAHHEAVFDSDLQQQILDLFEPANNEIDRLGQVDIALAEAYAQAVKSLLQQNQIEPSTIRAIGCHGQTIRHRPNLDKGFTLQIGDANLLATQCGIEVVADFRRKDIALGGEGAPLSPAFNAFLAQGEKCAFLNIGGIANISLIDTEVQGWDTGPGNGLIDAWFRRHHQQHKQSYDKNGSWAKTGQCSEQLLKLLLQHSYFSKRAPKSTGKEEFTLGWLDSIVEQEHPISPEDVQATLVELSAISIANELNEQAQGLKVYVSGGGIHNKYLMQRLSKYSKSQLCSSAELGINPDWMEAAAFAWLAQRFITRQTGNIPSVTGAKRSAVLGSLYLPD